MFTGKNYQKGNPVPSFNLEFPIAAGAQGLESNRSRQSKQSSKHRGNIYGRSPSKLNKGLGVGTVLRKSDTAHKSRIKNALVGVYEEQGSSHFQIIDEEEQSPERNSKRQSNI